MNENYEMKMEKETFVHIKTLFHQVPYEVFIAGSNAWLDA